MSETSQEIKAQLTVQESCEARLRRSEQQLADAQRLSHLGSWEWDIGADTVTASAELHRIFGVGPEELDATYEGILGMVHPDDREAYGKEIRDALAERGSYDNCHRIVRPDGTVRTLHSRGTVTVDETGAPRSIFGTCQDVTERTQAEEALRESEKLFRATFNQAAVGIAHTGLDGRWLRVNHKFCEILGYSEVELMGLDIKDITHPDDWERSDTYLQLMLDGELGSYSLEKRYLHKDGSTVWVHITVSMVHDPDGRNLFHVGVVEDITARKKIEADLQESAKRLKKAQEIAHLGSWELDVDGNILTWSDEVYRIFGLRPQEFRATYEAFLEVVHPDDRPAVNAAYSGSLREGRDAYEIEHRIVRRSTGEIRYVHEKCEHTRNETGRVVRSVGMVHDITERRKVEEALREEKEKFALAYQAMPSVLVIASLADGRYIEVNEAFERSIGYRRDEVIGRPSVELNVWQNPEDRAMVLRMLAEGTKVRNLEIGFRSKSGAIIIGLYSAEIIEIGAERCLLSLVNDITARKKMEEELRLGEERYRRLYNQTPVMLHSIDDDGRLVSVSDYWLETLGYERREVLGRRTTEFLTESSRHYATEAVLPDFFLTGSCKEVPYQFVKKNGEVLDVLLSAIAERNDEGEVVRSLAVMVDVTDRKRAEEEIEQLNTDLAARAIALENANRELEAFSYSVSHDLRKPLTVISGYSQVIRETCGADLDKQCRGYLQEIQEGTLRMNELIDALLRFSSLTRSELRLKTVDFSGIATTVAAELALAEPGRRVQFRIAEGITANGDAGLLRVVLENLLGNAWKYTATQEAAVIEFGVTDIDHKAACFVRDNGTGFDMAYAEQLFIPFQRLPGAGAFKGHGIGLATVERIIRRHGGRIWAEGEPGKGATFYFTLGSNMISVRSSS